MGAKHRVKKSITARRAQLIANEYCLLHYPMMFTGGAPMRLVLKNAEWWIVPIVLTSPGFGIVGEAGVVAIEAGTGEIVGRTDRREVAVAGKRLREGKGDELEAAFLQARTV
jgi:hypothetical protein